MAYLDHAATTALLPAARQAWLACAGEVGNASSLHTAGRRARRVVEEARESVAADLGVHPVEVVFTSGGTEADNLAVKGLFWARTADDPARRVVLASAVEHHAVLDPVRWLAEHEAAEVEWVPVDRSGLVDPDDLRDRLGRHAGRVALATVMWANNEVGAVQPMPAVAAACAGAGVPLHSDAVQAVGQVDVTPAALGVPAVAVSGHKIGGPTGVGALLLDRTLQPTPLLHGGGQERDVRSGTVDVAGAAAFAVAVHEAVTDRTEQAARIAALRDDLVRGVLRAVPDAVFNGPPIDSAARLPGNAHLSFPGCEGDALLLLLDAAGVACSTGSACTAGVPEPSHVLLAMGADPQTARGSLRFSLGRPSTPADVSAVLAALPAAVARARRAGPVRQPVGH